MAERTKILGVVWYYWIIFGAVFGAALYGFDWYNNHVQPIIGFEPGSGSQYWFYATVVVLGIWLFVSFFASPGASVSKTVKLSQEL